MVRKNCNYEIEVRQKTLYVTLCGEIDHHSAKRIRERVDRELDLARPHELVLDFSGVGFMDSSGIGLIMGRAVKAEAIGATVVVQGLSAAQKRIVRMSGIERLECVNIK